MIRRLNNQPYQIPLLQAEELKTGMIFGKTNDPTLVRGHKFLVLRTKPEGEDTQKLCYQMRSTLPYPCWPIEDMEGLWPIDERYGRGLDGRLYDPPA